MLYNVSTVGHEAVKRYDVGGEKSSRVNLVRKLNKLIFSRKAYDTDPTVLWLHGGDTRSVACVGDIIERFNKYKYLGIIIDHKLS